MERVLDLGCGTDHSWRSLGLEPAADWQIIGVDLAWERVRIPHAQYATRGWRYLCARGENIPLSDGSVHGVISGVALPYMHIPRTLAELHRVLVPGGWMKVSLHAPVFTWSEFLRSFPKPKQSLFRTFVFLNGMLLHFTGKVISLGKVAESSQTETGMRIALRRAGFRPLGFRREGLKFFVEAVRD
jgi:ubiquinone/menaquinone biosynthesis C-methylase UbiE